MFVCKHRRYECDADRLFGIHAKEGPLKDPHLKRQDFDKILNDLEEPICPYCKRIFSSRGNLRRHMEIHIMSDRRSLLRGVMDPLILKTIIENTESPYCTFCKKKFSTKGTLKRHIEEKHISKRFQCDICFKTFHRENYISFHKKMKHNVY
ncbi:Zinc finger and BTB domain-containing protein like [Argiope bruennichi]|uniref:Zinc finger and BTB domain-containing protein like n=1 Tax=Argiope bruennichi TaxID=94029 RepID=A0A8T0E7K4_ARGBR|nr:Zinc finger and BTB domain-containing protein like [Argiope bruennichi]